MILLVKSPGLILEIKVIVYTGRLAVKYWQRKIQNQDGSHGTAQKKRWIRWDILLQEFDTKILYRSEIYDTQVNVTFIK